MQLCAITDRKRLAGPQAAGSRRTEAGRGIHQRLRGLIGGWIDGGVDYIQLREKDLDADALRLLAEEIFAGLDRRHTKLLINFRFSDFPASTAELELLAPVADGIHIPGPPAPGMTERVRRVFRSRGREAIVSMSCHTLSEISVARDQRPDFVLFAPVFEKVGREKVRAEKIREKIGGRDGEKESEMRGEDDKLNRPEAGANSFLEPMTGQRRLRTAAPGQGLDALRLACQAALSMPVLALGGVTSANAEKCVAAGAQGVAGIRLFAEESWRRLSPIL